MTNVTTDQTTELTGFVSHSEFDEYASDYEKALNKGVSLSGESPAYFASKRVEYTAGWLKAAGLAERRSVVDFGCGIGNTTPHFRQHFPEAQLLGVDVSAASIERARELHGRESQFLRLDEARDMRDCDLVYCNGVFHHIAPLDRRKWAARVLDMLSPEGLFALWENNPWNPGTRIVMRRIPFDRDAITLSAGQARHLLMRSGFEIIGTRFRFYFPKVLSGLRPFERFGERVPLGAQYCVLARKPAIGGCS